MGKSVCFGIGIDKFARALLLELFDGKGHTYEIVGILRDEGTFGEADTRPVLKTNAPGFD